MQQAPDFQLFDQDGNVRSLDDYKGRWLVVFFYPSDYSANCRREACAFRDEHTIVAQFGNAEVIGINKGSVASHKRFSDKNHLNFPLLSDPTREVTKAYDAWRSGGVRLLDRTFATRRNTYIINPEGEIAKVYRGVRHPRAHATEVISELQSLQELVRN